MHALTFVVRFFFKYSTMAVVYAGRIVIKVDLYLLLDNWLNLPTVDTTPLTGNYVLLESKGCEETFPELYIEDGVIKVTEYNSEPKKFIFQNLIVTIRKEDESGITPSQDRSILFIYKVRILVPIVKVVELNISRSSAGFDFSCEQDGSSRC